MLCLKAQNFFSFITICSSDAHLLAQVSAATIPSTIFYYYVPFQVLLIILHFII